MRLLLITLLALTAAVVAGHFVAADPGFIVIGYGGKVLRTTFAFFLLASAAGLAALYFALRLLGQVFGLRQRWRRWSEGYRRRRAHRTLTSGMLALAEGEYARAERLFNRGADADAQPEVHYLAAAEAAQALNAPERRDNYLKLAQDLHPDAAVALDIKRATWQLDRGQFDEAASLVTRLEREHSGNPQVLRLRLALARHRGDPQALLDLVPALRRDRVLAPGEIDALEQDSAIGLLQQWRTRPDEFKRHWSALSKALRGHPAVLGAYVRGLIALGQHDEAETLLRKRLDRDWDSALAALYGEVETAPPARQLKRLEAWGITRGDDAGLRLARARVALRAGLWGQARGQLETLLAAAPSALLHRLLAEVADGVGDTAAANEHRRRGLELATGATPVAHDDSHAA